MPGRYVSLVLFMMPFCSPKLTAAAAEVVNVEPPLVEGRAIYAGPEYLTVETRALISDKVCEALGFSDVQSDEAKFGNMNGSQELAFVGKGRNEKLTFYFKTVGRPDKKETVGYLTKLVCFK